MVNFLENPEQFKAELKDKWLDYYQANRNWIQALMDGNSKWYFSVSYKYKDDEELEKLGYGDYSPRRPESAFILGVVVSLEPQLKGLFIFAPESPITYIDRLGLDFDPEIELTKRFQQQLSQPETNPSEYLDKIREEIKT